MALELITLTREQYAADLEAAADRALSKYEGLVMPILRQMGRGFLSIQEIAEMTGRSRSTVSRWIHTGIEHPKLGFIKLKKDEVTGKITRTAYEDFLSKTNSLNTK